MRKGKDQHYFQTTVLCEKSSVQLTQNVIMCRGAIIKKIYYINIFLIFTFSPHGGHSTAGDFDSEVDSTVSSRRGSRRRDKHINRNEGNQSLLKARLYRSFLLCNSMQFLSC